MLNLGGVSARTRPLGVRLQRRHRPVELDQRRDCRHGKITSTNAGTHDVWVEIDNGTAQTVTVAYTIQGDANLDFTVDGSDLNTVLSNYNKTGMTWSQGDFNGDGKVDGSDLNVVLSNYNQGAGVAAAVPEPSTLLLAAAGLIGLLAYAWRKTK